MAGWAAVVPIKSWSLAKSRLTALAPSDRRSLARALAENTLEVLAATRAVERCIVVGPRDLDHELGRRHVHYVADPGGGLNRALRAGLHAATARPAAGLLILVADLPHIQPSEIEALLAAVPSANPALVRDADGSGTTALAARDPAMLVPSFGHRSASRHLAAGAVEQSDAGAGLRQDLDTNTDMSLLRACTTGRVADWYRRYNDAFGSFQLSEQGLTHFTQVGA